MYKFRLVFNLTELTYFDIDDQSHCFQKGSNSYIIFTKDGKKINQSSQLVIEGTGFSSDQEAYAEGQKMMNVLRLYSVSKRTGVHLGTDKVMGGISDFLQDRIRNEKGIVVLNEVNGLMTYEDSENVGVISVSPTSFTLHKSFDGLKSIFDDYNKELMTFSNKLTNALDIYNGALFSPTPKLRFLMLVISIEAIIERTVGSSISQAGRELVKAMLGNKEYNGRSASEFFRHCYRLRSDFVHRGIWNEDNNDLAYELENLVVELLAAKATRERLERN
ncbi:hypothetical protein EBB07_05185 [Paenibacillaceae bacterium]|nr:hypothetical protein EBB07_05185 [Paenibacillaceae bacterium]